jgi:hypothetical protein
MKKIYTFWFLAFAITAFSQKYTQYNIKGDEAMNLHNYTDATIWYEEGVAGCNQYSIGQLTKIWLENETMRPSMYSVMSRCLNCLIDRVTEIKDTASINNLILYYTQGIGTQINENAASFWREQFDAIIHPPYMENVVEKEQPLQTKKKKNSLNIFIGYSVNLLAPAGLTLGITGKSVGGYVRYRTNLSSQKYTEICNEKGIVKGLDDGYRSLGSKEKVNTRMITGGLVFKPTQKFLISIGAGYWIYDLMKEFEKINLTLTEPEGNFWAKYEDPSYKGIAIDLDGTCRIGKIFYVSAGCSFLDFKYVYGNAGMGIFF